MFIRNQLYAAVNVTVAPTFSSVAGLWQSTQPLELSAALAGALGDRIFLGGEVRWAAQNLIAPFGDRALYIGPSLYVKLRENLTAYDATFVALAEAFDAVLVTGDERLAKSTGPRCAFQIVSPA